MPVLDGEGVPDAKGEHSNQDPFAPMGNPYVPAPEGQEVRIGGTLMRLPQRVKSSALPKCDFPCRAAVYELALPTDRLPQLKF